MSPASSCFSFETSVTTSPLSTVELVQRGRSRVEDTTYFGRLFNLSAHSPGRDDHRVPNHSSLRRPSSRSSAPSASSNSTLAHSSRSLPPNWPNQPPSLKPSSPSGSWTTPSSETFVLITIFPISVLLFWLVLSATPPAGGVGCESPCALAHLAPVLITTAPIYTLVSANGQSLITNVPSRTSTVFVSLIRRRRA